MGGGRGFLHFRGSTSKLPPPQEVEYLSFATHFTRKVSCGSALARAGYADTPAVPYWACHRHTPSGSGGPSRSRCAIIWAVASPWAAPRSNPSRAGGRGVTGAALGFNSRAGGGMGRTPLRSGVPGGGDRLLLKTRGSPAAHPDRHETPQVLCRSGWSPEKLSEGISHKISALRRTHTRASGPGLSQYPMLANLQDDNSPRAQQVSGRVCSCHVPLWATQGLASTGRPKFSGGCPLSRLLFNSETLVGGCLGPDLPGGDSIWGGTLTGPVPMPRRSRKLPMSENVMQLCIPWSKCH